ncbi:MAG: insulinase family protein [Desulfobacter sp.]
MRLILWVVLLALVQVMAVHAGDVRDPYKDVVHFRLDNGLQVYLLGNAKAVNTQMSVTVDVGTEIEDEGTFGLSHLVEHMVFRDERVPHRDFLDYFEDEGATYVNGFTSLYETEFQVVIDSSKSYWAVETLSQMLFDKQLSGQDLAAELGAIQTEIGEERWYEKYLWRLGRFLEAVWPPQDDFYLESFGLDFSREMPPHFKSRQTYRNVTLEDVLTHYHTYYYPANMTLKVAGNFEPEQMKSMIREVYGPVARTGSASARSPAEAPVMTNRSFVRFIEGNDENLGYIGARYILDDYKKYIVLDAYVSDLAERLQQILRNRKGATYSIDPHHFGTEKAMVASIRFDGLRKEFETNIDTVREQIREDLEGLSDDAVQEALNSYQKIYQAIENDSSSLMNLIDTVQYLRKYQGITDRTGFEIFRSITPEAFRGIVAETFRPENTYSYIYRDYYFFPYEMPVVSIFSLLLLGGAYFNVNRLDKFRKGIRYTRREVVMTRRLSNRFLGFMVFAACTYLTSWSTDWIWFLGQKLVTGDGFFRRTIDVPHIYILTFTDPLMYAALFLVIYRTLFRYYARMDVTETGICLVGNRAEFIPKEAIAGLSVEKWRPGNFRKTIGYGLLFWRPVLKIKTTRGRDLFLRSANAVHLKEDLEKWSG